MRTRGIVILIILALAFLPTLSLAHTVADPFTTPLMAGRYLEVGQVQIWNDVDNLYIKYQLTEPGWLLTLTSVQAGDSLEAMPQTKKGNPKPEAFDYPEPHDPGVTTHTVTIPLVWETGQELCLAAFARVLESATLREEGAWAAGEDFPGKNWATYFTYTVQVPPELEKTLLGFRWNDDDSIEELRSVNIATGETSWIADVPGFRGFPAGGSVYDVEANRLYQIAPPYPEGLYRLFVIDTMTGAVLNNAAIDPSIMNLGFRSEQN